MELKERGERGEEAVERATYIMGPNCGCRCIQNALAQSGDGKADNAELRNRWGDTCTRARPTLFFKGVVPGQGWVRQEYEPLPGGRKEPEVAMSLIMRGNM